MQDTSYHNLEDITIWVFHEILKTGDLSHLGKHKNPEQVWLDMYEDYCQQSNIDVTNIKQMRVVVGLEKKHEYIIKCLEILRHSKYLIEIDGFEEVFKKACETLRKWGYLFNESKPFEEELERLEKQSQSLEMKIKIESEKIEKNDKKQAIRLWRKILYLQKITGIKLDPRTDVMSQMIELEEMATSMSKKSA